MSDHISKLPPSSGTYWAGCRCVECREAQRIHIAEWRRLNPAKQKANEKRQREKEAAILRAARKVAAHYVNGTLRDEHIQELAQVAG